MSVATPVAVVAAAIVLVLAASSANAQGNLVALMAKAKSSTVFIRADATDSSNGSVSNSVGSGVMVSDQGHVLTAFHVIKPWFAQTHAEKLKNKIFVRIGSIYEPELEAQLVSFEDDEPDGAGPDFAILKIRRSATYMPGRICFASRKQGGEPIVAFGFPGAQEYNFAEGKIASDDGPGGRWVANINFDPGMSGGPVYDAASGHVVGLVKGGAKNFGTIRFVTQIIRTGSKLSTIGVAPSACATASAAGPSAASLPDSCDEIGFTDMSVIPPRFSKRIICR